MDAPPVSDAGCARNRTSLRLAAMDAPPVGMRVGTSISALQKLHKMLLVPQKPLFPGPGHDARFARLRQDGAPNNGALVTTSSFGPHLRWQSHLCKGRHRSLYIPKVLEMYFLPVMNLDSVLSRRSERSLERWALRAV